MWRWCCMNSQEKGREASTGDGELDGKSRSEPLNEFHFPRTDPRRSRINAGITSGSTSPLIQRPGQCAAYV